MSAAATGVIPSPSKPRGALALPAVVIVAFFLLAPLALILRYSLDKYDPTQLMLGVVTAENYIKLFGDPFYQNVLLVTARIALISTCVTILLSFPVAYCISRAESERWRSRMIILVVLPLLLGNAVRSAAWMVVMGTKGVVNSTLLWIGLIGEPLTILYTPTAVVIALVSVLLPYAIITMQSVMDSIPKSLEEAAQSLGYSPARTIAQVVLPLAMPGLIAAGAICFALAKVSNWPFGSALACLLMASTILLTILSTRFLQKKYN